MGAKRDIINAYFSAIDSSKFSDAIELKDSAMEQFKESFHICELGYVKERNVELENRVAELEALIEQYTSKNETVTTV